MRQKRGILAGTIAQRQRLDRWLILSCVLAFSALAFSHSGDALSPAIESQPAAAANPGARSAGLSPLLFDANGPEDPYITFRDWRRDNRVTIVMPVRVQNAHRRWLRSHGGPRPRSTSTSMQPVRSGPALSPSVGTNVDA